MYALLCALSLFIRVLSPKILPCVFPLLGSILSTAIVLSGSSNNRVPIASINVLLPAPGVPVIPIL